ncbi:MAG TPA: efflux RND transporter periplasmic adaptor subunit [Bacteroidales bacterium]|nr:efflux RND transporter periplasmic adaptor subunit [Bacteroidales bacterium]
MKYIIGIGLLLLILNACKQQPEATVEKESSSTQNNGVVLSQEKISRAGIVFGRIEKVMLSYDVNARGQITILPQNKASVSVLLGGVIRKIYVNQGQLVSAGQALASYSHPDFLKVQQNYISNKNKFDLIEKQYERQKKLVAENITSEKEFQATEAGYKLAKADLNAAEAELKMLGVDQVQVDEGIITSEILIRAPISGIVDQVNASIGMFADMQQPIFQIVNLENLKLQVKVFEKDIPLIKTGQRVTFSFSGEESEENEAIVESMGSTVDPEGRVITVIAGIQTKGLDLIPGMFVSAKIHTSEQMLDALPENAIVIDNDEEKYGFYTTNDPNAAAVSFYKFNVETGFTEDGSVSVVPLTTLPANAMIALDGVYYLKSEMLKTLDE